MYAPANVREFRQRCWRNSPFPRGISFAHLAITMARSLVEINPLNTKTIRSSEQDYCAVISCITRFMHFLVKNLKCRQSHWKAPLLANSGQVPRASRDFSTQPVKKQHQMFFDRYALKSRESLVSLSELSIWPKLTCAKFWVKMTQFRAKMAHFGSFWPHPPLPLPPPSSMLLPTCNSC
mgnify:CR=1 FL=1